VSRCLVSPLSPLGYVLGLMYRAAGLGRQYRPKSDKKKMRPFNIHLEKLRMEVLKTLFGLLDGTASSVSSIPGASGSMRASLGLGRSNESSKDKEREKERGRTFGGRNPGSSGSRDASVRPSPSPGPAGRRPLSPADASSTSRGRADHVSAGEAGRGLEPFLLPYLLKVFESYVNCAMYTDPVAIVADTQPPGYMPPSAGGFTSDGKGRTDFGHHTSPPPQQRQPKASPLVAQSTIEAMLGGVMRLIESVHKSCAGIILDLESEFGNREPGSDLIIGWLGKILREVLVDFVRLLAASLEDCMLMCH
jgi:hypothetical protein